jgi:hypothetical protein
MITVKSADSYLIERISKNTDEIEVVWEAFKEFCNVPVEGEEGLEILFYFDFLRQFTVYDENEYSHMEQLHCEFAFYPSNELKKIKASEFYVEENGNKNDFFEDIEKLQAFRIPLKLKPIRFKVYQHEI